MNRRRFVETDVEARTLRPRVALKVDCQARVSASIDGRRAKAQVIVIGGRVDEARITDQVVGAPENVPRLSVVLAKNKL